MSTPEYDSFLRKLTSTPHVLSVGDQISHFQLLSKLGEGGTGVVYAARDLKEQRDVALKIFATMIDGEQRRRFLSEARAASAVHHPNVVTIYEVGEGEDCYNAFIAMELIRGSTLRARMVASGAMPVDEATRIIRDVASALAAAHRVHVVHRDIKPENVMISDDGYVKLLDFGLAKIARELRVDETTTITEDGRMLGTPSYMSPEQSHGKNVDARSDVFSLGVMFYEMLSGRRPFRGETILEILISLNRDIPTPLWRFVRNIPPELEHVIKRCLLKEPHARYADGGAFLHALEIALSVSCRSYGVMVESRRSHAMALLPSGELLLAGGFGGIDLFDSAEVYNPTTRKSAAVASMLCGVRGRATATLLLDGTVLVVGGQHSRGVHNSTEIYDSTSKTWLHSSTMHHFRVGHTATLLKSGEVLVIGGFGGRRYHDEVEIFNPTMRRWSLVTSMTTPRQYHTATLLPNSRILVIGGYQANRDPLATTEIYDPDTNSWSPCAPMARRRACHTATLLINGKILVAGGLDETATPLGAELYDPIGDIWHDLAMIEPRYDHTATRCPNGSVMVIGGLKDPGREIDCVGIYDPEYSTWSVGQRLSMPRAQHCAILLENSETGPHILLTGGSCDAVTLHNTELVSVL